MPVGEKEGSANHGEKLKYGQGPYFSPPDVRPLNVPRLPRDVLDRLASLHALTSTASDACDGIIHPLVVSADILQPRLLSGSMVGHAVTVRYLPERRSPELPHDRATPGRLGHFASFAAAQPGDVVVMDATGCPDASLCGGMGALFAQRAGIGGFIVDGGVRDIDEYRAIQFPVWSRGVTPRTGKYRVEAVSVNAPIACGGQQVQAGDLVLADESGVCFVPPEHIETVVARILAAAEDEDEVFRRRAPYPAPPARDGYPAGRA